MGEATKIIRTSIKTFFNGYQPFISVAILFIFPFSASTLLSNSFVSSSPYPLQFTSLHFRSLFQSASFPASSRFFSIINLKLSETLVLSIFRFPFTLTFLILSEASVIQITHNFLLCKKSPPPFSSLRNLYSPLLTTHIFNSFLIVSVNATIFALFFLVLNAVELIRLSSDDSNFLLIFLYLVGAVFYSVAIACTVTVCNLATIVSGMEICDGYISILLKVYVLIKDRMATALAIALPGNLLVAAVEALFQYRVMRRYYLLGKLNSSIAYEAFMVAYVHSVVVVVKIIASCLFYKWCRPAFQIECEREEKGEV